MFQLFAGFTDSTIYESGITVRFAFSRRSSGSSPFFTYRNAALTNRGTLFRLPMSTGEAWLGSESYRKTWTAYPPALEFMDRTQLLTENSPVLRQPAYIGKLLDILAATYLPLLFTTLGFGVMLLFQRRHRSRLGCLVALVLFVYLYSLASCLEVATIHSLENPRYMIVQMYFAILAQFLALWLIFEVVLELFSRAEITSPGTAP